MNFLSRDFSPLENLVFFTIKSIYFNGKLLSSQTHLNDFVLFESLRKRPFQRVQYHFGGWSVSRAICKIFSAIKFRGDRKHTSDEEVGSRLAWGLVPGEEGHFKLEAGFPLEPSGSQ